MSSFKVAVEALSESQIKEITLDGQEIYTQPLSMSENLTRLAHKIDFSKDESVQKGRITSESTLENEQEEDKSSFEQPQWPWQSVHTKLKQSLTEMSVLLDVLNVVKEKHYMVLDAVQAEPPEPKLAFQLLAKKKSLTAAATILLNGAEQMKVSQTEINSKPQTTDFHYELLKLRQKWRLKKVGNIILGDLSYRSCGSQFWQSGTFEVTKRDIDNSELDGTGLRHDMTSLQVTVPSELEGIAYIQVAIRKLKDDTDIVSTDLSLPSSNLGFVPHDMPWQKKLEYAQNVIFCKEVFQQLAREAVQTQANIPHIVVGNKIFSHLFPGIQLSIVLCHNTDNERKNKLKSPLASSTHGGQQKMEYNQVLEHSLHQLLREAHYNNLHTPMPHPVTALLGLNKKRRQAGPNAFSRAELREMSQRYSLLEQVVRQAQHIVMFRQTMWILDDMALSIKDPQIVSHWSPVNSAEDLTIKGHIISYGYEIVRSPILFHIGVNSVKAITKDGRAAQLGSEQSELRNYMLSQIATHQISVIQTLTKCMGWTFLSIHSHVGVGNLQPIGCAPTLTIASPNGNRVLSFRSSASSGVSVTLQECGKVRPDQDCTDKSEESDEDNCSPITDAKWRKIGGEFKTIDLDSIEGRYLPNKLEMLMATLSDLK